MFRPSELVLSPASLHLLLQSRVLQVSMDPHGLAILSAWSPWLSVSLDNLSLVWKTVGCPNWLQCSELVIVVLVLWVLGCTT